MKAERLLEHYERISDAPDAIARLRRFILDLAVRGKIVPQDAKDEPAAKLLTRITTEMMAIVRRRKATYDEPDPVELNEQPFEIPSSWSWARLGNIADLVRGISFSASEKSTMPGDSLLPCFRSGNIQNETVWGDFIYVPRTVLKSDQQLVRESDILISIANSYELVGKCSIVKAIKEEATFGAFLAAIRLFSIFPEYVMNFLACEYSLNAFRVGSAQTTNIANITFSTIRDHKIPVPPLAEQHRIVAKVDELMALCDRLEAARAEREATRDRLTASTLARLNTPDPTTFQADARFALNTLPALTTRPDQIKQLRQTILNLAVRGKLEEQDPKDEPAVALLKRITKEISTYAKANRIGPVQADRISVDDLPFYAPPGWQWSRLCNLFNVITDGDHQPPPKADVGVAFLTIGNITTGQLDFAGCRFVPDSYFKALAPYRIPVKGDILYTVVGATYGRPALVETDRAFCIQRHIAILRPAEAMSLRYLVTLLASPLIYDQATQSTTGTAQPTIGLRPLRNFLAPIPPLVEQHRIVAKVDALMKICDQLEASLDQTASTRRNLLDALLAEAISPAATRKLEAAE
jgi:type I restriction enzyme S subunit